MSTQKNLCTNVNSNLIHKSPKVKITPMPFNGELLKHCEILPNNKKEYILDSYYILEEPLGYQAKKKQILWDFIYIKNLERQTFSSGTGQLLPGLETEERFGREIGVVIKGATQGTFVVMELFRILTVVWAQAYTYNKLQRTKYAHTQMSTNKTWEIQVRLTDCPMSMSCL